MMRPIAAIGCVIGFVMIAAHNTTGDAVVGGILCGAFATLFYFNPLND